MRRVATAAAKEADDDWARRLSDAVQDVRAQALQRDRDQADEIAALHQALHDVEQRARAQLDREYRPAREPTRPRIWPERSGPRGGAATLWSPPRHRHFQDARLDADAAAHRVHDLELELAELRSARAPPARPRENPLDELANKLQAMHQSFRRAADSVYAPPPRPPPFGVPPTIEEHARFRSAPSPDASSVSVGVAALAAVDAETDRRRRPFDDLDNASEAPDRAGTDRSSVRTRNSPNFC